ncbi:MAG: ATP-dependent Clp protease adaptor ClpS [Planctomycetota bacterium]|nr:ATP-dependent Clp protease adaptor ClpS [Planctomycetota bacterium]
MTNPATPESSAATATRPQTEPPKVDLLPPFKVLLHNDDVNTFEDVVQTIMELTPLARPRALEVMLEAHEQGVALVLVTHKEAAEFYQERFQSKRVTVTIEPA